MNEAGSNIPKALVTIGSKPLIWHLMRLYASYGYDDFVLCVGYLQEKLRAYFGAGPSATERVAFSDEGLRCTVALVDTGPDTNTGGRIKRAEDLLADEERFFVTYGDGLSDVNLNELARFHERHGRTATLTAVHPVSSFGILELGDDGSVIEFREKPKLEKWINGGFFVFERRLFDHLDDGSVLEQEPLAHLARNADLMAFRHEGFWKCMDTFKDNAELNALWSEGAPWRTWQTR